MPASPETQNQQEPALQNLEFDMLSKSKTCKIQPAKDEVSHVKQSGKEWWFRTQALVPFWVQAWICHFSFLTCPMGIKLLQHQLPRVAVRRKWEIVKPEPSNVFLVLSVFQEIKTGLLTTLRRPPDQADQTGPRA